MVTDLFLTLPSSALDLLLELSAAEKSESSSLWTEHIKKHKEAKSLSPSEIQFFPSLAELWEFSIPLSHQNSQPLRNSRCSSPNQDWIFCSINQSRLSRDNPEAMKWNITKLLKWSLTLCRETLSCCSSNRYTTRSLWNESTSVGENGRS